MGDFNGSFSGCGRTIGDGVGRGRREEQGSPCHPIGRRGAEYILWSQSRIYRLNVIMEVMHDNSLVFDFVESWEVTDSFHSLLLAMYLSEHRMIRRGQG